MARLTRCPSCRTHIFAGDASCPFCKVRLPLKGLLVASAGVVAFVSGIGCAYGCPDGQCGGPDGGGGTTTTSTTTGTGGTTTTSMITGTGGSTTTTTAGTGGTATDAGADH